MKVFDLASVLFAFGLATVVVSQRSAVTLAEFLEMRVKIQNFIVFAIMLLVWHQIYILFGMYASRRLSARWDETLDVLKAASLGTMVIFVAHMLLRISLMTPEFLGVFWLATVATTLAGRVVMRLLLRQARMHGRNLRDVLIVGTNPRAVQFARKIRDNHFLGYRVIGFVDQDWHGMTEFSQSEFNLACNFDNLLPYLRSTVVDEVVMALPMRSLHARASEVSTICEEQGILVRFISNLFDGKTTRTRVVTVEDDSIITHNSTRLEGWSVVIKRAIDIAVSLSMTLLLLPVFLLTALLIKLTSPGPVFFVQKRIGLNKRHFGIYKFRTMVADAEKRMKEIEHLNEVSGPVFKIKNDPRITPIGKFLRKTSIDELPQLFNVLRGDMSLVGPRPLPLRDYEGFSEDWQRRRFSVRPGVTCLWQIGGRSSVSFEKWMELDLQYIDDWSLLLDFKILLKTIPAVLKGSGAA
jgi:exopolysaccharide biosynthesis polyprenyl glycosylphosphotransferase